MQYTDKEILDTFNKMKALEQKVIDIAKQLGYIERTCCPEYMEAHEEEKEILICIHDDKMDEPYIREILIPFNYLYEDDFLEQHKKKVEEEQAKEEARKRLQEKKEAEQVEALERAKYERLKQKFEQ